MDCFEDEEKLMVSHLCSYSRGEEESEGREYCRQ